MKRKLHVSASKRRFRNAVFRRFVVRNYKDTIFRMLYSDRKELLKLCNALNGTNYTDADLIEIKTLENAIYLNVKNDISFIITNQLYLYEHQGSYTPNMPLRDLFYVADQLQELVSQEDLYRTTLVKIPAPNFIVFYNGLKEMPERAELRLSDSYIVRQKDPQLELKVTMININRGCNQALMEQCKTLRDYSIYVDRVRTYSQTMSMEEAVETAIEACISEDILKDFLIKNRSEAIKVTIYEFDQELHDRALREDGWNEGRSEGWSEGWEFAVQVYGSLARSGRVDDIVRASEDREYRDKLFEEFRKNG